MFQPKIIVHEVEKFTASPWIYYNDMYKKIHVNDKLLIIVISAHFNKSID